MRNIDKLQTQVPASSIAFILNSLSEMNLHGVAVNVCMLELYSSLNLAVDENHIVTAFKNFWDVDEDLAHGENLPELLDTMGGSVNVLHCLLVAHLLASNYVPATIRKYEGNLRAFKNDCLYSAYTTIKSALQGIQTDEYTDLGSIQEIQKIVCGMSLTLCTPKAVVAFKAIREDSNQALLILDVAKMTTEWALELDPYYANAPADRPE